MPGKLLYGALFIVVVPGLLVLWAKASQPNVSLPAYGNPVLGSILVAFGLTVMLAAMWQLWSLGGGLPMNAFPPTKLVSRGLFHWLPHPIYTAFVAMCIGISMLARSAAGLWLVTPTVTLACAALVLGYERLDLERRFGDTLHLLPADEFTPPSNCDRLRFFLVVIVPWLALYEFTVHMNVVGGALGLKFEDGLPIYPWTTVIYESCYLTVALAPWCARTRRDLRQFMISAWVAIAIVFPIYWLIPLSAPRRPMAGDSWAVGLLNFERSSYPPTAAFPSFHVLWAIFVGRLFRPKWLGVSYAAAVALSCVTTGMHYIFDVIAAFAIAPLLLQPRQVWRRLLFLSERIANSWQEWRFGPVRIINHSFYAGAGGFAQVAIMSAALGPGNEWQAFIVAFASLLAAGAWAQWIEGSSLLRRPFGFYGGLVGAALCCLIFEERWILLGACCLSAPWMQAIGRLRCLVNGCCHGAPAPLADGIRVTHARSRVIRLANLAGIAIYPTQLYSIISNIFVGLLLLRLWFSACPLSLVCGVYGIGNGISRFIEEAYRGEPQTLTVWGLRLYQWMALGSVLVGAAVTTQQWPSAPALVPSFHGLLWALAFAVISAAAMGLDFPEANRPLARLT